MKSFVVPQFNIQGEKTGDFAVTVALPDKVNSDLLAQAVRVYRANQRQNNAKVKTKGEVSGGGKKPWKQKGTGRARQGSTRSPQWRHGGVAHGPQPRDLAEHFPATMAKLAFKMALLDKITDGKIAVLASGEKGLKTKDMALSLAKITTAKKLTLVSSGVKDVLVLAGRNIARVSTRGVSSLNSYDIIATPFLIVSTEAAVRLLK